MYTFNDSYIWGPIAGWLEVFRWPLPRSGYISMREYVGVLIGAVVSPSLCAYLANITPITMVYGTYNYYSIHGVYKPTNITGGPHKALVKSVKSGTFNVAQADHRCDLEKPWRKNVFLRLVVRKKNGEYHVIFPLRRNNIKHEGYPRLAMLFILLVC